MKCRKLVRHAALLHFSIIRPTKIISVVPVTYFEKNRVGRSDLIFYFILFFCYDTAAGDDRESSFHLAGKLFGKLIFSYLNGVNLYMSCSLVPMQSTLRLVWLARSEARLPLS